MREHELIKKISGIVLMTIVATMLPTASVRAVEDLSYGRPMTDEEVDEQLAMEPEYLPPLPESTPVEDYMPNTKGRLRGAAIPSRYDMREYGFITPVQNQNPYGNCWSFATLASFESSLIKQGIETNTSVNLSESHLTYYVAHTGHDELGNTLNDTSTAVPNWYVYGGNTEMSTAALSNWKGAALESQYTHLSNQIANGFASFGTKPYLDSEYYLKNTYVANMSSPDEVKNLIMTYGAAYTGFGYFAEFMNFRTNGNGGYYCPYNDSDYKANHAVTIVGWDDNYSASNFKNDPGTNGAWLCKNSWGTYWDGNGYFYISYKDAINLTSTATVFVGDRKDSSLNNYYYSGSTGVGWQYYFNGIAESFTAKGNGTGREAIESAGFLTEAAGVGYTVKVFKASGASYIDINTAEPILTESGMTTRAGYYMHEFDNPVSVDAGDRFVVAFYFDRSILVRTDRSYNYGDFAANNVVNRNESYSLSDNGYFVDTYNGNCTPRMNIITRDKNTEPSNVSKVSLGLDGSVSLNMYTQVSSNLINSGAYAVIDGDVSKRVPITTALMTDSTEFSSVSDTVECRFNGTRPAKGMKDAITLQIYEADGTPVPFDNNLTDPYTFSYSIREYIDVVCESDSVSDYTKTLAMNLLCYGHEAQNYFGYEVDEEPVNVTDLVSSSDVAEYDKNISGALPEGLEYVGTSLMLKDKIAVRHYFRVGYGHNVDEYDFDMYKGSGSSAVKVADMKPTDNDGLYYVVIENIPPTLFGQSYTLKVNSAYQLTYNVYSYAYDVLSKSTNQKLQELIKALYAYGSCVR